MEKRKQKDRGEDGEDGEDCIIEMKVIRRVEENVCKYSSSDDLGFHEEHQRTGLSERRMRAGNEDLISGNQYHNS